MNDDFRLLQQVVPQDAPQEVPTPVKRTKQTYERPNFSLPIMSNNFRRLNARIGVVFVFQKKVSRILSWQEPTHTLSLMAVYTFCCLNPNLLIVLPLVVCLFFIMEPAFVARHPPASSENFLEVHTGAGPASAPPVTVKPVPEASKDFFRNMRDLQNSMEDFTIAHDGIVQLIGTRTNFSDERLSTLIYQSLFALALLLLVAAKLIPWRLLALLSGWALVGSFHPEISQLIASFDKKPLKHAYFAVKAWLVYWMNEDILLDESPRKREVEVFELQRQTTEGTWGPCLYGPAPYDLQSPARIAGNVPKGATRFEDVQPPKGWQWNAKLWRLDLQSHQWVEDRMITAVDIESDGDRWVYDIGAQSPAQAALHAIVDGNVNQHSDDLWRRRRWTRTVRRKVMVESEQKLKIDSKK